MKKDEIEAEAKELYPEVLPMNRGVMSYDELDEHNFQMEDKREGYIAGRSKGQESEEAKDREIQRLKGLIEELWQFKFYVTCPSTVHEGVMDELFKRQKEQFKTEHNL